MMQSLILDASCTCKVHNDWSKNEVVEMEEQLVVREIVPVKSELVPSLSPPAILLLFANNSLFLFEDM